MGHEAHLPFVNDGEWHRESEAEFSQDLKIMQ